MDAQFKKGDIVSTKGASAFVYEVMEPEPDVGGRIVLIRVSSPKDKTLSTPGSYVVREQGTLQLAKRVENGLIFGPKINRFLVMSRSFLPLPDWSAMDWQHVANCASYDEARQWIEAQGQTENHMFRIDEVWMAAP